MKLDFTQLIIEGTIETQYKDILNELVYDTNDAAKLINTGSEDDQIERLLYLISKYAFFLFYLEQKEEYEKCTSITNFVKVLGGMFGFGEEQIGNLLVSSLKIYQEKNEDEK